MVDRHPVSRRKRRVLEAIIRLIDIVAYLIILAGGIIAGFSTPESVQNELAGAAWLIPLWAGFLLVGGGLGAFGRISRIWILEPPACVAGIAGGLMYFVVLGGTLFNSLTAGVATAFLLYAVIQMLRRYIELQIFGTDPNIHGFADRVAEALRRRTGNVVPRED